jgi:DNA repair exonuclease SbcCD ATPase subunit
LVTDREIALVAALYVMLIMMVGAHNNFLDALDKHISAPQKESERQQELDLQEVYRRRQLVVKNEHKLEINQLQGLLHAANAKFDRLNFEYEWISNAYQDQMRSLQEQEDRLNYLERKLAEFGQTTPITRQPFSAPPSQIQFANPPRRALAAGAPSPLAQVGTHHKPAALSATSSA